MNKVIVALLLLPLLAPLAAAAYPQRIISGIPAATEMLFALGLNDRVVGVTTNCNYPPPAAKKPKVGGFALNLEKVASLKPDLIVMQADAQRRDIESFRAFGLPVMTIAPKTVPGVLEAIRQLGQATGTTAEAASLVAALQRRIASVEAGGRSLATVLRRPRVLVIVGYEPLIVAGGGTFIDDIVRSAGADNLAAGARSAYPHYSLERLLKDGPDYIIIPAGTVRRGALEARGKWPVLYIDPDIISRPGPRVVDAIETIARFINEKKI